MLFGSRTVSSMLPCVRVRSIQHKSGAFATAFHGPAFPLASPAEGSVDLLGSLLARLCTLDSRTCVNREDHSLSLEHGA